MIVKLWHKPKPPLCKGRGTAYGGGGIVNNCKIHKPTTPQSPNGASSTKARLRMPQALLRCPYTGEPNEVRADPFSGTDQSLPCVRRRKLPCSGGVGTACGGGRVVKNDTKPQAYTATYNPSVSLRCQLCQGTPTYAATYNPSVSLRCQLYQGTPTYATGITPVPLHRGAYRSPHRPNSAALTNASPV